MSRRLSFLLAGLLGFGQALAADVPAPVDHLERIRSEGVLRVCIWPDYYGISYRNPKSGELSGLDIDLATALGHDLGAQVRFVDSSFSHLEDDLLEDRCDVAMFAVGVTPRRQQSLQFTQPYLASDIYGITRAGNRRLKVWADIDRPGNVVAVAKGTLHETVMREALQYASLLVRDTPNAREQDVLSGRADVFMTDYPYSRRMLESTDWARLVAPEMPFHVTPYAYAVAPGDARWLARLNRFVADIKGDGRLMAAAKRHNLEPIMVPGDE